MARQEMLMARCDRKECNTAIEIDRTTEAPEGWFEIRVEIEGKYDSRSKLEFCSEKCVTIWARSRKTYKSNGKVIERNGHPQTNFRDEVLAAIDILHSNEQAPFTARNVADVAEIDHSTAGTWLTRLKQEEVIKVSGGDGKRGNPYVYEKV